MAASSVSRTVSGTNEEIVLQAMHCDLWIRMGLSLDSPEASKAWASLFVRLLMMYLIKFSPSIWPFNIDDVLHSWAYALPCMPTTMRCTLLCTPVQRRYADLLVGSSMLCHV